MYICCCPSSHVFSLDLARCLSHGSTPRAFDMPSVLTGLEKGGAFNRCRFARDGSRALFVTVNQRGEAHILHWEQV